ncbi:MAG TPA: hypothetical protein VIL46_00465, partial [Gemmataceae bacterium]
MPLTAAAQPLSGPALEAFRRAGNPFRNYFARNPDDEVCARYHVEELFAQQRQQLLGVVDLYRYDPTTHSEVVPVLGNKGAGKTHLLHSIKHGEDGAWQLLVTPGVYQKDTDFLEYLLFQIIDTLLGGGRQKGSRPLQYVGDLLVRRLLGAALRDLSAEEKVELFPPPGLGRWARRLGLGQSQAAERCEWLAEQVAGGAGFSRAPMPVAQALAEAGMTTEQALGLITAYVERTEPHNTAGLMRRAIHTGFARAVLTNDESHLAGFLTYGFAELEFHVRPTRQDLVLALFKVLMEVFRSLRTPVVVAFDQLEDLLLARRSDDAHRIAEAFFAGIVQVMHQIDGLCFLIFAERGLWNRFVPSLDGYIQDRLNNPVHVPRHGTVKALRLEAPAPELVRRVVETRLRAGLEELAGVADVSDVFPFTDEQVVRIARTEPTLRDMLQQFRHAFDHIVYGSEGGEMSPYASAALNTREPEGEPHPTAPPQLPLPGGADGFPAPPAGDVEPPGPRWSAAIELPPEVPPPVPNRLIDLPPLEPLPEVKSVIVVESPENAPPAPAAPPPGFEETVAPPEPFLAGGAFAEETGPEEGMSAAAPAAPAGGRAPGAPLRSSAVSTQALVELWEQEQRAALRKLEPEGALTGATRELQAGLGAFLQVCHEHGVKVGPWRLQHVVPEFAFGEHPTYGVVTIAHWACKDGPPWKVGIGLFLARAAGKPKDLEVKLASMESEPAVIDHLILLRPEDDLTLSGKSKSLWQEAERRGRHARLEPVSLEGFAMLYSFPRWLAAVTEELPEGQPLPNLAGIIQE